MDKPRTMKFGRWIKEQMFQRNLRPTECAERAGMPLEAWSRLTSDYSRRKDGSPTEPEIKTVRAVAKALDMPVHKVVAVAYGLPELDPEPFVENDQNRLLRMLMKKVGTIEEVVTGAAQTNNP